MQEEDDSSYYIKPHRVLPGMQKAETHSAHAWPLLCATGLYYAPGKFRSHSRQGWDRSKGRGGQACTWSSSHPPQETPLSSKLPRPPLLTFLAMRICSGHHCDGGPARNPVCLAGWGWGRGLSSAEIPVLAQPGGPSCCVHAAKKCLWMTTTPFLSQI